MSRLWILLVLAGCDATVVTGQRAQALGTATKTLWIDLAGDSVRTSLNDDALTDSSSLGSATVPAFDASIVAPQVDAGTVTQALVDRARNFYLAYDLTITTTRPTSGDYAAVLVGGTSAILLPAQPANIAGVGPVDCGDTDVDSVGFAFSNAASPAQGGIVALGATIAHEAGHGLGLEHVVNPHDPMYSVASPQQTIGDLFGLAFGTGDYSDFIAGVGTGNAEQCGRADPLDNPTILSAVLAPRTTPLGAAPTVSITFPPDHPTLPATLPVQVDAIGAARVELYRDLELVAVLTQAPYDTTLVLPVATTTVLTVEAVGADGQRATTSRTFAVDANVAPACTAQLACPTDTACVDGFCAVIVADLGTTSDAAKATSASKGGCDFASRRVTSPWLLLLVALLGIRGWKRAAW